MICRMTKRQREVAKRYINAVAEYYTESKVTGRVSPLVALEVREAEEAYDHAFGNEHKETDDND